MKGPLTQRVFPIGLQKKKTTIELKAKKLTSQKLRSNAIYISKLFLQCLVNQDTAV